MSRSFFPFVATAFITATLPLSAQTLDDRYEVLGGFEGTISGEAVSFVATYDAEDDRSSVSQFGGVNMETFNAMAESIGADGAPSSPGISFAIGPFMPGLGERGDVFYWDDTGYYVIDNDLTGRVDLQDVAFDEEQLQFTIEGEMVPVTRNSDGAWELDDSREALSLSGTFNTRLPEDS
jgi:hypothetical protein